jgi:gluconokinase
MRSAIFLSMNIPDLRSPREKTGGIVYFARMLDKIRLHTAGKLPNEYVPNLGDGFDLRCVKFLHIGYDALTERVKQGGSDAEILEWAFAQGKKPSDEEIEIWNGFMSKRGWNDDATPTLQRRLRENNCEDRTDIQTMFDYIDLDEGRDPKLR